MKDRARRAWLGAVIGLSAAGVAFAQVQTRYDQQKLVRVQVRSADDLALLERVSPDCWSEHPGENGEVDYRVDASALAALDAAGVVYQVVIEDLQKPIDEERQRLSAGGHTRAWFDDFKTLSQVRDYCDLLATTYPEFVARRTVGHALEGREIFSLEFTDPARTPGKPAMLVIATQHAREWIAVSSIMYVADSLARGYGVDSAVTSLLDSFDVYLIPVANPDGYEYTWTNDRYWRKNKRVVFDKVYGVDMNRNAGYMWGLGGSSSSASSEVYRGTAPFSEPESAAIRDYALSIPNLAAFVDLHSYGRLVLSPWGYTVILPEHHESFMAVGDAMRDAIYAANQQPYTVGPCNTTLYPVSGSTQDWVYGQLGIPAWIIELTSGPFVIAPSAIIPTGKATLSAVQALAANICPADVDHNGWVNGDDFDAFVAWFDAGDERCDFDRNGYDNADDFDAFTLAFERGCF